MTRLPLLFYSCYSLLHCRIQIICNCKASHQQHPSNLYKLIPNKRSFSLKPRQQDLNMTSFVLQLWTLNTACTEQWNILFMAVCACVQCVHIKPKYWIGACNEYLSNMVASVTLDNWHFVVTSLKFPKYLSNFLKPVCMMSATNIFISWAIH